MIADKLCRAARPLAKGLFAAGLAAGVLGLSGCGATLDNEPLNQLLRADAATLKPREAGMSDTLIGLKNYAPE